MITSPELLSPDFLKARDAMLSHSSDAGDNLIAPLVAAGRLVAQRDCRVHTLYLSTLSSPHRSFLLVFVRPQSSCVDLSAAAAADIRDLGGAAPWESRLGGTPD